MAKTIINKVLENKMCTSSEFLARLKDESPSVISFLNPFSYSLIASREDLVRKVDFWFVDGQALCFLTNLTRKKKLKRASFDFSSVAIDFFEYANKTGKKVGIIGSNSSEIKIAYTNISNIYPTLDLCYFHDGYIEKRRYLEVVNDLDKAKVELLIVGMGTPLQEDFCIYSIQKSQYIRKAITCGGFLTQTAIKVDYYHPFIKKLGLRWVQRAWKHKHVRNRLFKVYPKFILLYLIAIIFHRE